MNKNLKLFLGLSMMSVLSVVLFSAKNIVSAAESGYGYSCTSAFGYGYSCAVAAGGTYSSNPVSTVLSGGKVVSVNDLINNTPMVVTNPGTKIPMIINLSNGSTSSYGYGNTNTSTLDNGDAKFVLPNTGVTN